MRLVRLRRLSIAVALVVSSVTIAVPAHGADAAFDQPTATARLGDPVTFVTVLRSDQEPVRVELITRLPDAGGSSVQPAAVTAADRGTYEASVSVDGHVTPNTTFDYRFRASFADGSIALGPEARTTVVDDRFAWRTLEGSLIRLHWYEGDDAFAGRALAIGEEALAEASALLGVQETERVDFFIYAAEGPFREALGPGTRENVGGQANASIRTLFGLIEPTEIGSDWVDVLITHELTHLVFDSAIDNPYHAPPRWLNEGLAVYLSEGYEPDARGAVESAARSGEVIPLVGLGGLFPTTRQRFTLAYAESVSAVSFFIATFGQDELVALIRSYADGVTDDEAFTDATGADLTAFDVAWISSLGVSAPEPFGPLPAPPGPLPSDWSSEPPTLPAPGGSPATAAPGTAAAPSGTKLPGAITSLAPSIAPSSPSLPPPPPGEDGPSGTVLAISLGVALALLIGIGVLVARRSP